MLAKAQEVAWRKPEPVVGTLSTNTSVVLVGMSAVSLEQESNINMAKGERVIVMLAKRLTPGVVQSNHQLAASQGCQSEAQAPRSGAAPRHFTSSIAQW